MHIFQIIPQLCEGGAERFVVDLSNTLAKNYGCQITVVSFFNIESTYSYFKDLDPEIEVITLNKKLGLDLSIIWKLFKLTKKLKPDVIHTHLYAFEYMLFNSVYFKNKIKFINTIHNSPKRMYKKNKFIKFIGNFLYKFVGVKPVIISSDSIEEFHQLFPKVQPLVIFNGRPKLNVSIKYSKVIKEIEFYKKNPNTKVFINLARIMPVKNQLMLVDAFNILIKGGEDIILIIVGNTRDNEIINEIKCRISEGIYLLGYKDNPTDYLTCSNAFCLTSLTEGMPISLIEAIQIGVIPICTPAGGVKDIVNPSFGFISNGFSITSYTESLRAFLKLDDIKLKEMSQNAKSEYENNFTMNTTASKYYHLYNQRI